MGAHDDRKGFFLERTLVLSFAANYEWHIQEEAFAASLSLDGHLLLAPQVGTPASSVVRSRHESSSILARGPALVTLYSCYRRGRPIPKVFGINVSECEQSESEKPEWREVRLVALSVVVIFRATCEPK
jgi:hypothetical protein